METRIHPSVASRFSFAILIFFTAVFQLSSSFAQAASRTQQEFGKLADAYHSTRISAGQYFIKADSLIHQLFSEGKRFETKELAELLQLYEKIAWSSPQYGRDRVNYFYLFFNNARMFKQKGASMYYAEKIAEEYKKIGEEHPLIAQLQKCKIYQELRLYDKVIAVFDGERSYLESLPELLQQDRVDASVGINAMYILSPTVMGYIEMNDTASVHQTALLAKRIGTTLQQKSSLSRSQMLYNDLLMIDIEHSVANFEHRYDSASMLLDRFEALKTTYSDQATNFVDLNLIRRRIENYLHLQHPDSLQYYIAKYESSPAFGDSQRADLAEFKGKLWALQRNYSEAYASLTEALKLERDVQSALMAESSDLLYALTQAEHSSIALQKAEKIKQQRTNWLLIISLVASGLILGIYWTMLRRSKKAKEQIATLNNIADMQILSMEEIKHQAVREEQQRLGQDLHDGLSSSIASIKHQLEVLSMDSYDISLKNRLTMLNKEITTAYEAARNKSHEWFHRAEEQREQSFEKRIKLLADNALPDSRYRKDIHIDNDALQHVNIDVRIALLRIVQEAITNIIKHAKAKEVSILIYQETGSLTLAVKDDGKGLDNNKLKNNTSMMGIQSIRRRVQYLRGETKIYSDVNGTEIVITLPVSSL